MFGILVSAFNLILGWVVRSVIAKFFVFFALFFITTEFLQFLMSSGIFPSASGLNGALASVSDGTGYFLGLFAADTGISMVISAYATRFIIRRIPIIG